MKRLFYAALVFVAFGFYFSEAAAQSCDPTNPLFDPLFCDPNNPLCACFGVPNACPNCVVSSTTGSSVDCTLQTGPGTRNVLNTNAATFAEVAKAACHTDTNPNLGICDFKLVMTGVTLSGCVPGGTCLADAFCTDKNLNVTGALSNCSNAPGFVLNFGFGDLQRNNHFCSNVFPDETSAGGLPAGQVLSFTVITNLDGSIAHLSDVKARACNSGDNPQGLVNPPVGCFAPTGVVRETKERADTAVPFVFEVRQTVNTSPCSPGGTDHGVANIDVFGSKVFHVVDFNPMTLSCEGASFPQLECGAPTDLNGDGFLDLPCKVITCPTFGPALGALPKNPDGTVTVTCQGNLNDTQKAEGFDPDVVVSPQ